jgi:hypothetical protein
MAALLDALKALGFQVPDGARPMEQHKPLKPRVVGGRTVAELGRSRATCPHCGRHGQVAKTFGVRDMGNGTVRVQSWCRDCRRDPNNERSKAFKKGKR